jgi:hypothetical protein
VEGAQLSLALPNTSNISNRVQPRPRKITALIIPLNKYLFFCLCQFTSLHINLSPLPSYNIYVKSIAVGATLSQNNSGSPHPALNCSHRLLLQQSSIRRLYLPCRRLARDTDRIFWVSLPSTYFPRSQDLLGCGCSLKSYRSR